MTFTVTYREKDGTLREEAVEAAGRAECFAQMKARGIVPVGVKEGRSSSRPRAAGTAAPHAGGAKPRSGMPWKAAILAAAALAVAGGVWCWLAARDGGRPAEPKAIEKPKVKKAEKLPEARPPKPKDVPAPATNAPAAKPEPFVRPANWKEMTKEERAAWNEEHPRPPQPANVTMGSISDLRPKTETKPIFHHSVHLELSHYAIPGRDMPPPDRISDKQALAAAEVPIEYLDSDTPELRAKKEAVEMMLQEMKEYIQNGGHANDYMNKLAARQQLEGEAVEATRRDVRALMREGKMEEAKVALEKYNEYLKTKGIPPIRIKGLK